MPREDEREIKEEKAVEEMVEKPMSDGAIKEALPNAKIILYNELKNYNSIDQILPHSKSYAIILYQNSPNSGHWVGISRPNKNTIEVFDSYGNPIDKPLSWISKNENIKLGIDGPYLTNLLNKSGYNVIHNTTCFQGKNGDISTCGRHACFRIKCMLDKNMDLEKYTKMMKNVKNSMNKTFDELVAIMLNTPTEQKEIKF